MPAIDTPNVVHLRAVIKWIGATIPTEGDVTIAYVTHSTSPPGDDDWTAVGAVALPPVNVAENDVWLIGGTSFQRFPGVDNRFSLTVVHAGTFSYVGEVTAVQSENVAAKAELDPAVFAATLYEYLIDNYEGMSGWDRSVTEVGKKLVLTWRSDHHNHPEVAQHLRDLEYWGYWRVIGRDDNYPLMWFGPEIGDIVEELLITPDNNAELVVSIDASEASTEVLMLSNGQDGPTRDEGTYKIDPLPGALLMHTEVAPYGTDSRDLETIARRWQWEDGTRAVLWSSEIADGPVDEETTMLSLPADWIERIEVGDYARAGIKVGVVNHASWVQCHGWTWTGRNDKYTTAWRSTLPPPGA